jgi:Tol biopolymer transport system component
LDRAERLRKIINRPVPVPVEIEALSFYAAGRRLMLRVMGVMAVALILSFGVAGIVLARGAEPPTGESAWNLLTRRTTVGNSANYQAFVSNPDGGRLEQMRVDGIPVVRFECSPDGSHMVFVTGGAVYTVGIDGENLLRVSGDAFDEYAYFSVNNAGTQVVYSSSVYPGLLTLVDMENGRQDVVSSHHSNYSTSAISPNGRYIIYSAGFQYNNPGLWLVDTHFPSAQPRLIGFGIAPVWSPDGSMIAYSYHDGDQADIHLLDMKRFKAIPLTHTSIFENGPAWSPDGRELVFVSYEVSASDTRIELMDWDGSNRREVRSLYGHFSPCIVQDRPDTLTNASSMGR